MIPMKNTLMAQRASVWAMIVAGLGIAVSFVLVVRWVPLPSPADSAAQVARMYTENVSAIRTNALIFAVCWSVWILFSAVIAAQLSRQEPGFPFWSIVSFGGGLLLCLIVTLNAVLWGVASFRPDRAPDVTQALNDFAWFLFVVPAGPLGLQILSTGIVALAHSAPGAAFPRWYGYLSLWMFTVTMPGFVALFFKTGPLAWNGVFAIYVPGIGVGVWAVATIYLLLRTIREQLTAAEDRNPAHRNPEERTVG